MHLYLKFSTHPRPSQMTGKAHRKGTSANWVLLLLLVPGLNAIAQDTVVQGFSAQSLGVEIVETILYSIIGILMAVIGFKVVDWLTPGSLAEEVTHKENRALAILAGSMMLGVCIIIASVLIA